MTAANLALGRVAPAGTSPDQNSHDAILDAVVQLIETKGYDAVQLRDIASEAHVSLSTIYKRYGTRDELMVAAIARWMDDNRYAGLKFTQRDEPVFDGLMRVYRTIFEPWERHPRMLHAYHRARSNPGADQLVAQGRSAVEPISHAILGDADPEWMADVGLILWNMVYALMGRFTDGEIAITEILPTLERTLFRLTDGCGQPPRAVPKRQTKS
ncbi:TetR family transcriptional regulator [Jatrophihabitans sp. DSM 45814]